MPLFRRSAPPRERTPEERERDRAERAARRAAADSPPPWAAESVRAPERPRAPSIEARQASSAEPVAHLEPAPFVPAAAGPAAVPADLDEPSVAGASGAAAAQPAQGAADHAQTDTPEPRRAQVALTEPPLARPTPREAVAAEPVAAEPVAAEPVAAEPVAAGPASAEPVAAEPVAAERPPAQAADWTQPPVADSVAAVPVDSVYEPPDAPARVRVIRSSPAPDTAASAAGPEGYVEDAPQSPQHWHPPAVSAPLEPDEEQAEAAEDSAVARRADGEGVPGRSTRRLRLGRRPVDAAPLRPAPGLRPPPPVQRARRPGSAGRRRALAVAPLVLAAVLIWFAWSLFEPVKGTGQGRVDVTISAHTSVSGVGKILARQHVVSSALLFSMRAFLSGKRGQIRPGHFVLARDMSYGAALKVLTTRPPPVHVVKVLVPEGNSRREIAHLVRRDGLSGEYLSATVHSPVLDPRRYGARRARNLEGFLFPATYQLPAGTPASQLVSDQLQSFARNFRSVNLSIPRRRHLSPYDVLIIASLVEREAGVARDRPLVAAVIYNRLKRKMPLGIDASIRYVDENWSRPLSASELRSRSPYNTRLHRGLPPTPIGNPGLASIRAAVRPAHVPFLYFVVKPGGHGEHLFSKNFAQFKRDAARYRGARARNGGRSPTR